jgi:hypothetical protein
LLQAEKAVSVAAAEALSSSIPEGEVCRVVASPVADASSANIVSVCVTTLSSSAVERIVVMTASPDSGINDVLLCIPDKTPAIPAQT